MSGSGLRVARARLRCDSKLRVAVMDPAQPLADLHFLRVRIRFQPLNALFFDIQIPLQVRVLFFERPNLTPFLFERADALRSP